LSGHLVARILDQWFPEGKHSVKEVADVPPSIKSLEIKFAPRPAWPEAASPAEAGLPSPRRSWRPWIPLADRSCRTSSAERFAQTPPSRSEISNAQQSPPYSDPSTRHTGGGVGGDLGAAFSHRPGKRLPFDDSAGHAHAIAVRADGSFDAATVNLVPPEIATLLTGTATGTGGAAGGTGTQPSVATPTR